MARLDVDPSFLVSLRAMLVVATGTAFGPPSSDTVMDYGYGTAL